MGLRGEGGVVFVVDTKIVCSFIKTWPQMSILQSQGVHQRHLAPFVIIIFWIGVGGGGGIEVALAVFRKWGAAILIEYAFVSKHWFCHAFVFITNGVGHIVRMKYIVLMVC